LRGRAFVGPKARLASVLQPFSAVAVVLERGGGEAAQLTAAESADHDPASAGPASLMGSFYLNELLLMKLTDAARFRCLRCSMTTTRRLDGLRAWNAPGAVAENLSRKAAARYAGATGSTLATQAHSGKTHRARRSTIISGPAQGLFPDGCRGYGRIYPGKSLISLANEKLGEWPGTWRMRGGCCKRRWRNASRGR